MSHHYEGWILHEECPGHWELEDGWEDGRLAWLDGPLRPEDAILSDFLKRVSLTPGRGS